MTMSILIKGMEMPNIPAFREKDNKVAFPAAVVLEKGKAPRLVVNYKIGYVDTNLKAYELVEVPTPHGRLIDADRLLESIKTNFYEHFGNYDSGQELLFDLICSSIEDSLTIIEAEVSEE